MGISTALDRFLIVRFLLGSVSIAATASFVVVPTTKGSLQERKPTTTTLTKVLSSTSSSGVSTRIVSTSYNKNNNSTEFAVKEELRSKEKFATIDNNKTNDKDKRRMIPFVSSCLSTQQHSSGSSRDPTIIEKLYRRLTVFGVAFQVFIEYKWASRTAKRRKRQLGLSHDDPNSDDHPDIIDFWSKIHTRNALRLLRQIKNLAGFWVKVGQYLSTRADIMPPEYLKSLAELQDSMPPKPFNDVLATIREELDGDTLEAIESIDPEPLSTASLAQVHRATLKDDYNEQSSSSMATDVDNRRGREVVLKVQHRGVASLMLQDMENLRVILELLAKTDPDLDFSNVISEYNQEVRKELDFRMEADNMQQVSDLLRKNNVHVIIPKTIPGMITKRVLVMDFCKGFPVKDTKSMDEYDVNRELLLERICKAWAIQMHVGGLFNADPHGANILVSTSDDNDDDASVPVLLDFGLTKRLDPPIKLAFARLMHASYEGDVDALIQSFNEMGLKMNRHDPMEDMAAMQRGFGDTVPQKRVREIQKEKSANYKSRVKAQRAEAGLSKGQKLRNPVEAWPSELVFFGRVTNMLRGLCSQLDISYPYLKTMAEAAKETIKASVPLDEHADGLVHHSANTVSTNLQRRILNILPQIEREGHMVGLQLCVLKDGQEIVNVAAGTVGIANPRPITPSTLFNVFSVSKGVLTIGVLRLLQEGRIESLDDPVCKYWPAFAANNKSTVTIRHLLTHQAGLSNTYPEDATLDTLLDWSTMTTFMAEGAEPSHKPGEETQYHALTYAWLVGGLIEAVTGRPYEEWFNDILPDTTMTGSDTSRRLFLAGISKELNDDKDLAILSMDRRRSNESSTQHGGRETTKKSHTPKEDNTTATSIVDKTQEKEDEVEQQKKARKVLAKYRGLQQLLNPSIFNMRKVREAKLPSANGHASASSLAYVFDGVIRPNDPILSPHIVAQARIPAHLSSSSSSSSDSNNNNNAMLNDSQASFGLGFQLHEFIIDQKKKVMSIGHAGVGGSVVLAIPEERVVVALTLNHLSSNSDAIKARQQLLGIVFDELGWQAPPSIISALSSSSSSRNVIMEEHAKI